MRIIRKNREDIGGQSDWFLERRLDGLATNPAPALHRIGDEQIEDLSALRLTLRQCPMTRIRIWSGEPRELLRRAIACTTMTKGPGGEGILSGQLPQELAEPFARALMRIEAERLLHDADLFTSTSGETRTQSERRADAFTAMILRLDDN